MKKTVFTGSGVAIITPFTEDGKIDFESLGKMLDYHVENNTDAIIICGTTGEAACMSHEEHVAAIKFAVDYIDSRIPVIAGTGSNDTEYGIKLSKEAENLGADALRKGLLSILQKLQNQFVFLLFCIMFHQEQALILNLKL